MFIIGEAVKSRYCMNEIGEDLIIYSGKFHIYSDIQLKCDGVLYYKLSEPVSINFSAKIYKFEDLSEIDLINFSKEATLEISGYKLMSIEIESINNGEIIGYVNDNVIKSKDNSVQYIQFDILNMDKVPGKLVNYDDLVYAGRLEFKVNDYKITIDKSYNYNKDFHNRLVSRNGSVITHTGKIEKYDGTMFNTRNIYKLITQLSIALSFSCGRFIAIPNCFGYSNSKEVYRSWHKMYSNNYQFVFNWTSTISNYYNFEKYLSLMTKKLEETYYFDAFSSILDWYVESLNGINMGNNIISIQTALEMLSYVVLVELERVFSREEYDNRAANQNIRELLKFCSIDHDIPFAVSGRNYNSKIKMDSVDLITQYRNIVVHPSKKNHNIHLDFEEMWNIVLCGISYIELVILYIINYRGEYTNRFKDLRFGDVEIVPWSKK